MKKPGDTSTSELLLCGGTGNCQLWVFRKSGGEWLSLFADKAPDAAPIVDGFRFGPGVSVGIKDLTVTANTSAEATTTVTYKFDGKLYRAKR